MDKLTFKAGEQLSHAYIIAAPSEEERSALAGSLAAAFVCEGVGARPCGVCRHCRKAMGGIHPDVFTLRRETDDKGRKKRELLVDQVRFLVSDAQVMPNEAERKVYIVEDADSMNTQAQNAFLKLLEEPPRSAAFILCCGNPSMLLPTVRSRCALIQRNAREEKDAAAASMAAEYLALMARGGRSELLRWCVEHEGTDPRGAEAFLAAAREAAADALLGRTDTRLAARECVELERLLARCAAYMKLNTSTRHIFGLLAVDAPMNEK